MEWREVKGYEGYYVVNELGEVKALTRKVRCGKHGGFAIREERLMVKQKSKDGYETVNLSKGGKNNVKTVHRLVATAFVDNPNNKEEVNHIDCNRINNKASNLEWVTRSENIKHSYTFGLKNNKGENNGRSKLKETDIPNIKDLRNKGVTLKEISKKFGISISSVDRIVKNQTWGGC